MKSTIVICLESGFLQEVHTNLPEDVKIKVKIMDVDCYKQNPGGPEAAEYAECEKLLKEGGMRSILNVEEL